MAIFFTSDTHFGHAGALALDPRPFVSIAAMDAAMVQRWGQQIDVGVDVWDFHPHTLQEMVAQTRRRKLPAR
jgi:calcineurin-like phosphoesterase family protein